MLTDRLYQAMLIISYSAGYANTVIFIDTATIAMLMQ